ncbi:PREDICTED: protein SPIRAL1-like 5 [Nelumbo nucifera]|uniref:Protein SPIRAL1-like 5 n=2 Tax=Nelumbo nucifera TaxID=4432 RepID=A0A822XF73_NELNU|nr:PREDICTED: protein SPIRAL1-like 5 [Nelumbo nucifera]DAD19010.1 TPA_asm: hypothetical protein HUJ06_020473 [Nelumbo nucifera]
MSKGGSYGGGQSSLGYLFGSEQQPATAPVAPVVTRPPWGDDNSTENAPYLLSPVQKRDAPDQRDRGSNTGTFITDRPSTKVKSVPGGNSSLGYLFGDK